jgi:hypothetical protein
MLEKQSLDVELVCVELPAAVPDGLSALRLGVQAGQAVEQDAPCPAAEIVFRFLLQVAIDRQDGAPRFSGPYVHGPRGGKFLYLCWGDRAAGEWQTYGRAKLSLGAVEPGLVETALRTHRPLRARVRLTDARGRPATGSLKSGVYEWMV